MVTGGHLTDGKLEDRRDSPRGHRKVRLCLLLHPPCARQPRTPQPPALHAAPPTGPLSCSLQVLRLVLATHHALW